MHKRRKIVVSRYGKPAHETRAVHKIAASLLVLLFGSLYGWMLAGAPPAREVVELFTQSKPYSGSFYNTSHSFFRTRERGAGLPNSFFRTREHASLLFPNEESSNYPSSFGKRSKNRNFAGQPRKVGSYLIVRNARL